MENNRLKPIVHPFAPIYDSRSKILILGTIPSPKSREAYFYYGHPQNNFWRVLAAVLNTSVPCSIQEKKALLLDNKIALWDVLHSCDISGADDGSIKNPVPNDFSEVLRGSQISAVFANGTKAAKLYMDSCYKKTGLRAVCLPSTSPANRRYYNFDKLVSEYMVIKEFLKN